MATNFLAEPTLLALKACLTPQGYSKSGSTFRLRSPETVRIVALQSSTESSADFAKITVNLGVYVLALQDSARPEKNPSVWVAHWRVRIGHLTPEHNDVWWSIRSAEQSHAIAPVIVRCVEQYGLPALNEVATVGAVQKLWLSGRSPGLSEGQRIRCLQRLAAVATS